MSVTDDAIESPELDERHLLALDALKAGHSGKVAAERATVDPATISRWRRWPPFAKALRRAQRERVDDLLELTNCAAVDAVAYLRNLITDPGAPRNLRFAAAQTLSKFAPPPAPQSSEDNGPKQVVIRLAYPTDPRPRPERDDEEASRSWARDEDEAELDGDGGGDDDNELPLRRRLTGKE